jgi:hypothetical protein
LDLSSYLPYIDATSVRAVGAQERSVGMRIEGLTTFVKQGIEWDEERCRLSCA